MRHTPGNIYIIEGVFNLLSQFRLGGIDHAVLISLDGSGNRWVDPIQVGDMRLISEEEMKILAGGKPYELYEKMDALHMIWILDGFEAAANAFFINP